MKLGRLFWKFLLMFWLAQIITAMGVGVMIWASHRLPPGAPAHHAHEHSREQSRLHDAGPPLPPRSPLFPPLPPIAAGSIVSLIFAWLLAFYFARPIRTLHEAFEAEANGKLDTRVGQAMGTRRDELADLGKDFDLMADRLQSLVESHRRLLHDVSHELRSPLARLEAACDLLHQQPERAPEFIGRMQRDIDRVDDLVGELLTLSRLDTGMNDPTCELFNLTELVYDVAADVRFEAEPKGCTIELALCDELNVNGNFELLRRAVENVLRNAVRHSPEGYPIYVNAKKLDNYVHLSITDAGSGVDPSDLQRIFDPFYRAADAQPFEGYGLGLTITQRVVRLYGGSVLAENLAEGGFVVHMRLPLVQPQTNGQPESDL